MKIVIEGIDGVGKTTILKELSQVLENSGCNFKIIDEIEDSPISDILSNMLSKDPFFRGEDGKFLTYATLMLLADHQYKQNTVEFDSSKINIFDRDYPTLLVYQQRLLKDFYQERDISHLLSAIEEFACFDIVPTDLLVYVSVPLEMSVERVKCRSRRENEQFNDDEILFLKNVKNDFEKKFLPVEKNKGRNILYIDGTKDPIVNANIIANEIVQLFNKGESIYEKD